MRAWRAVLVGVLALGCSPPHVPATRLAPASPSASARGWYLRARMAEERGELDVAEQAWDWVVRDDALRPEAWVERARFFERHGRWADAEVAWRQAHLLEPTWWVPEAALAWQAHRDRMRGGEALAATDGDRLSERYWLERAAQHGGDAQVLERLVALQLEDGAESDALETLQRWRRLPLERYGDRIRRAEVARALGAHDAAVDDLIGALPDDPSLAPLFWDSARRACRLHTAWRWARSAPLDGETPREILVDVGWRVGDAALMERARGPVMPGLGPAPAVGEHVQRIAGDVPVHDPALQLAEAWRQAGQPDRAVAWAETVASGPDLPWAWLVQARARIASGDAQAAAVALDHIPLEHAAGPGRLALALELGLQSAARVQADLGDDPERTVAFGRALSDAVLRGVTLQDRVFEASRGVMGDVVVLDRRALAPWRTALLGRGVRDAMEEGRFRDARRLARAWTQQSGGNADAWVALAQADVDRSSEHAARALMLEPCNAHALVLAARGTSTTEALGWLDRAREADPLSSVVRRALAQRGLEAP